MTFSGGAAARGMNVEESISTGNLDSRGTLQTKTNQERRKILGGKHATSECGFKIGGKGKIWRLACEEERLVPIMKMLVGIVC